MDSILTNKIALTVVVPLAITVASGYVGYKAYQHFKKPDIFQSAFEGDIEALYGHALRLNFGGSVDQFRDKNGSSPVHKACEGDKFEAVKLLVDRMNASIGPEMVNQHGFTSLHLACFHEASSELINYLLTKSPQLIEAKENGGWTPLLIAASKGNLRIVTLLVQKGANVNATTQSNQTPLYIAANNGFSNVVMFLLDHGADPKIRMAKSFESPAFAAMLAGHMSIFCRLIDVEPELLKLPSVSGATLLHAAAQIGRKNMLEFLIEAGADIEAQKKDGSTPLAAACAADKIESIRLLLEKGANTETKNGFGGTPLHTACNKKQLDIVLLLLNRGADPNATDNDKINPLQSLCGSSSKVPSRLEINDAQLNEVEIQIAEALISSGIDLNHRDRCQATFLHQLVCKKEHFHLLKHIITKYQVDPFVEDRYGLTPLHLAYTYRHTQIIDFLEDYMRSLNSEYMATFDRAKPRKQLNDGANDIIEAIPFEDRKSVLNFDLSLAAIAHKIQSGEIKNVIVLTGAGISTNSGIPDFRSPEKGLYTSQAFKDKFGAGGVSELFSPLGVANHPEDFYAVVKEIFAPALKGQYRPTLAHFFIKLLNDKGILTRNYTQNIDTLESLAGIDQEKVIEAHGSFSKAHCTKCRARCESMKDFWADVDSDEIPRCAACRGVMRPNVVFFGEGLPSEFSDHQVEDFKKCDLLIVMGTSLKVYPFAGLVNMVGNKVPRLLFNLEPVGAFVHGSRWQLSTQEGQEAPALERIKHEEEYTNNYRDVSFLGDIDKGVEQFVQQIGWVEELKTLSNTYQPVIQ